MIKCRKRHKSQKLTRKLEKTAQKTKRKWKSEGGAAAWGESDGYITLGPASEHVTNSSGRHIARSVIGRAARVWTSSQVRPDASHREAKKGKKKKKKKKKNKEKKKNKTQQKKKKKKKGCRKIMFPKYIFRARMYQKLITQSNNKSKICKHIIKSQVINEHKFPFK